MTFWKQNLNNIRSQFKKQWLEYIIFFLGASLAIYHLVSAFVILQSIIGHYIVHGGGLLILVLLISVSREKRVKRFIAVFCLPIAIATVTYIWFSANRLEGTFDYYPNIDFIIGISIMAVALIATWVWWGAAIPLIIVVAILYFFFGHLLPYPLHHPVYSAKFVMGNLVVGLGSGMFADLTPTSANTIFYFMLLGAMLQGMGVVPAFTETGKIISRSMRGGPAYVAVIASSLVGMISGSGSANVVLTGSFTIPAMKSLGVAPEEAGGIEAAASGGGQITPPVMGAGAFIMAAFLGMPYLDIIRHAIIGAILLYFCLFMGVMFYCYSRGLSRHTGEVNVGLMIRRLPIFVIPLVMVIVMLLQGRSITMSATIATLVALVMGLVLVPESRSLKVVLNTLKQGAIAGAQIAIVCLTVGMMVTIVSITGLGPKLTTLLFSLTGGLFLPSIFLIAAICIILGMGLPVTGAYILTAILMIPSLWAFGVDRLASHMFAFYYAAWSPISPPVAPSAMVASRISGGDFWRTALFALKLMIVPFLFPIILLLHPQMLNFPVMGSTEILLTIGLLALAVANAALMNSWFVCKLSGLWLFITGVGAASVTIYLFNLNLFFGIAGLLVLAGVALHQWLLYSNTKKQELSQVRTAMID